MTTTSLTSQVSNVQPLQVLLCRFLAAFHLVFAGYPTAYSLTSHLLAIGLRGPCTARYIGYLWNSGMADHPPPSS